MERDDNTTLAPSTAPPETGSWRDDPPVLLGRAGQDTSSPTDATPAASGQTVKASPKGWTRVATAQVWDWMARPRPPLPVVLVGAEGGVGTTTVSALVGEIIAAASPGPTVLLDQCGSPSGTLSRRLVGQRAGITGEQVLTSLTKGDSPRHILSASATTSAGACLVNDSAGYTPVRGIYQVVRTACGGLVVDGGRIDLAALVRADELRSVVVLVGRADVIGAEAVCAALGFLRRRRVRGRPVVVLSATSPMDRRRVQAATKLVTATGASRLVFLPHDQRLATGESLRLDLLGKATVAACLSLVSQIGTAHEEQSHGH